MTLAELDLPQFGELEVISNGVSSTVVKGIHKPTHTPVAIKLINVAKLRTTVYVMREITTHRQISHPFVADFYGCLPMKSYLCYCQEFVSGGSLLDKVNRTHGLPEPLARRYFCQLISALRLLHEQLEVVHRDIKLENLMIDSNDNLKLIDFGFVSEQVNMIRSQCGSIPYAAPEVISAREYTAAVDLWSAGVVLYTMLTGQLPFRATPGVDVAEHILRDTPDFPPSISPNARDMLIGLLTKDPAARYTIDDIRVHPWVSTQQCSMYMSDEYLNEVTNTGYFDPLLLNPFPDMDPNAVKETLDAGMDDSDTITYMILKHFNKLQNPSYCGIVTAPRPLRSSMRAPSVDHFDLQAVARPAKIAQSRSLMRSVKRHRMYNMSRGSVGLVTFRVRSHNTQSTALFDLASFKQTFVNGL